MASEDRLIQLSLDLFHDALRTCALDILAGQEELGRLERTLTNIIGAIGSLDESMLPDTLLSHLEMIKSLLVWFDRLKHNEWDVLMDEVLTSYVSA